MAALPQPIDPAPVADLTQMNETLATVTRIYGEAAPETVELLPAAAVVLLGIKVETTLLENQKWDNFWIGIGGHLNDVWHSVGSFLFGHSGAPSLDTVSGLIRLSMHVQTRLTRQLITGLASRTVAVEVALWKGVSAVDRRVTATQQWAAGNLQRVYRELHAEVLSARTYALSLVTGLVRGIDARIAQHTSALRAELVRDVINPLRSEVTGLRRSLTHVAGQAEHSAAQLTHTVLPELAGLSVIAHEAYKLAQAAKAWEDDCGEPMCETVGPKTDWGKLLKRFGPTAIFALLAAIAAENPDKVEAAAADLGKALGPVLGSWAEEYLGLSHGDKSTAERTIGGQVGQFSV